MEELVAQTVTAYAKAMNRELKASKGQIENGASRIS